MTRRETRRTRRVGWLAALLGAFVLALSVMPVTAWAAEIEVGEGEACESLPEAVTQAQPGDTIKLTSNITLTEYVFVDAKDITIDGGDHTVTRGENFATKVDGGRGGYNPAMIEVANNSELTLVDITLDDGFRTMGTEFELAGDSAVDNSKKVHDGIIASYGDGHSTIVLGEGTTLKNFGGLSAVYITGEDGDGAKLIMKSGSKICDDSTGLRKGGYAAIFNHGGTVEIESGSSIEGIDGRAVYIDNAGATTVNGTIEGITTNDLMVHSTDVGPSGSSTHFGGIVAYVEGNSVFRLGETGAISNIKSHNDDQVDTLFYLNGGKLETAAGSLIDGIQIVGLVDSNGGETEVAGTISNCATRNVLFRLRGTQGSFFLRESGRIVDNQTTDAGLLYLNGGKPTIEIAGTIDGFNTTALFISNNGSREDGSVRLTETGVITNVAGDAILAGDPSKVTVEGTITDCAGYAVLYGAKGNGSLLTIDDSAKISGNHGGGAQVSIKREESGGKLVTFATDTTRHAEIAPGAIEGNTTIDLPPFDVTLDEGYAPVKLGSASDNAVEKIKQYVVGKDPRWEVVGSDAVWLEPFGDSVHFVASGLSPAPKNTGLYVAYVELDANGDPVVDAAVSTLSVDNSDDIDVTLTGLKADTAYAVMFFNNAEYTLAPDDVTVYTGGGQGNEDYNGGGFPALTIDGSVDPIESLVIGEGEELEGDEAMRALLEHLEVAYYDGETQIHDDSVAGEYVARLSWKGGQKPGTITINGNEVSDTFDEGKLVVRYVEDVDEAVSGDSTYEVLNAAPAEMQDHAVAVVDASATYRTNGDAGAVVTDASGISLLDDSLLTDQGDDRQRLLEERAADHLGAPDEGQAYRFAFRYLDLVDAHNGNAWVSSSEDATVYLPYPDGMTYEQAKDIDFTVLHFRGLHREYGITGPDVVDAIAACEVETVGCKKTEQGISFTVGSSGFSPFAVVWQTEAHTITASAGNGGTIAPFGNVTVAEGADQTFAITPSQGYEIADVRVDGTSVGAVSTYTFENVADDHKIEATFRSTGGGPVTPPSTKYYEITASAGEGGSISPSGTHEYAAGADVSFSISPDEGYTVGSVTVDGVNVGQRTSYTFADLDADHTISVTFMPGSAPADPDDTGVSDWLQAGDHIAFLHGYGDGSGTFGPENDMTRAEVAQMFYNLLLDKSRGEVEVKFEDIPADAYYAEAVLTLASRGIVNGTSPETYEPNRPITRAEFVAIAMRFSNGEFEGENTFVDVPEDAWYRDYVVGATSFGWIVGYQDGSRRFGPEDTITRGQATMVTNRMLGRVADGAWIVAHLDDVKTFVDLGQDHYAFFDVVEATNAHDYERADGTRYESWTGLVK